MPIVEDGRAAAQPFQEDDGTGYFHFAIDRRLSIGAGQPTTVDVEYFDRGDGSFDLEYDSLDPDAPEDGVYKTAGPVVFENTQAWRVARFTLPDPSFRARQYDGIGDFRLHDRPGDDAQPHAFGRVRVTADAGLRPVVFGPESLTFVAPAEHPDLALAWSDIDAASGYVVEVAPFDDRTVTVHGFTPQDRRRCLGETGFRADDLIQALTDRATCRLSLSPAPSEGLFRWRVRAIDGQGQDVGSPSDWAFFVVAGR
jgi:hypothetical protein